MSDPAEMTKMSAKSRAAKQARSVNFRVPQFATPMGMSMKQMPVHFHDFIEDDARSLRTGERRVDYPSATPAALLGMPMHFAQNTEIYGDGEPAEYVYKVIRGAVRAHKSIIDGRRQVAAFYLPGDIFGLELLEEHSRSAEAVIDADVLLVKRSSVLALAECNSDVAHWLWSVTAADLYRSQNHVLLLAKNAQGRVAGFLLEMAERLHADRAVELPMTRRDIADYLGLAIETLSRTMTEFKGAATIDLPASRRVVLRDRSALRQLNA